MTNRCMGIVVSSGNLPGPILHRCGNAAKGDDTWCPVCGDNAGQLRQAFLRAVLRPVVVDALENGHELDAFGRPPRKHAGRPGHGKRALAPPPVVEVAEPAPKGPPVPPPPATLQPAVSPWTAGQDAWVPHPARRP